MCPPGMVWGSLGQGGSWEAKDPQGGDGTSSLPRRGALYEKLTPRSWGVLKSFTVAVICGTGQGARGECGAWLGPGAPDRTRRCACTDRGRRTPHAGLPCYPGLTVCPVVDVMVSWKGPVGMGPDLWKNWNWDLVRVTPPQDTEARV